MKALHTAYYLGRLDSDASAMAWVNQWFREGQEEKCFPKRAAPEGSERCYIIQHACKRWAGFCTFFEIDEDEQRKVWIDLVYVLPEFRQEGIGRRLMRLIADANPDLEIMLGTALTNEPMRLLAQSVGIAPHHVVFSNRPLEYVA